MISTVNLILISLVIVMILPFIFAMLKASYHFEYLKEINSKQVESVNSIIDGYTKGLWNWQIGLLFPYFERKEKLEKTKKVEILAKRTELFKKLTIWSIVFLISIAVILISLFGETQDSDNP